MPTTCYLHVSLSVLGGAFLFLSGICWLEDRNGLKFLIYEEGVRTIRNSGFFMLWFNNNNNDNNNINYLCHTIDAANARNCRMKWHADAHRQVPHI